MTVTWKKKGSEFFLIDGRVRTRHLKQKLESFQVKMGWGNGVVGNLVRPQAF